MARSKDIADYGYRTNFKNAIINGNFDIWQRGTSFPATANGAYVADRFKFGFSGAMVYTTSQSSDVPNINSVNSLSLACTTPDSTIGAGDYVFIQQIIEGYNILHLLNKEVVLSFYVKSTIAGTMCISFSNSGNDRSYVQEITINTPNTWEKKEVRLTLDETGGTWDYTNGSGLIVSFCLACGTTKQTTAGAWQTGDYLATSNQTNFCNSTDTVLLSQTQLEIGQAPTPFEYRLYQDEFNFCQRYYQKIGGDAANDIYYRGRLGVADVIGYTIVYKTEMRTIPTAGKKGTWFVANCSQPAFQGVGKSSISIVSTASSVQFYFNTVDSGTYIDLDAEL